MVEALLLLAGLVIGLGLGGYLHYRFGANVRRVEEALRKL